MSLVVRCEKFFVCLSLFLFLSGVASESVAGEFSVQIRVKGISCPFCVYGIEKKIKKIPGVESIETNYKRAMVSLTRKKGSPVNVRALEQAVKDAGFSVDSVSLHLQGVLTEWKGKPALKEKDSHQLFLLIELGRGEPYAVLSAQKLKTLKKATGQGQNMIWIQGEAHHHGDMPLAITVETYGSL